MTIPFLRPRSGAAALPALLLLSACALGPAAVPPAPRLADLWVGPAAPGAVEADQWWRDLHDPLLDALVAQMLAGNPDLREAQARLAEARALRDAARGGRLPQVNGSMSGSQVTLSENGQIPVGQIPGFSRAFGLFDIGFDASWEIDLWGRQSGQANAAQARADAAGYALEGARVQLVAELARAYVGLRLAQAEQGTAEAMLEARTRLATLTELRAQSGEAGRIEADRAQADAAGARLLLANAEASVRAAALQVVRLVGGAPSALIAQIEAPGAMPLPPAAIGAGLPAELLRRRPDLLAAEQTLVAASADVGVARADLFPRLSLGLAAGQQARAVDDLLDAGSTRLQAGPSLLWPIFNGGRARALVRAADARAQAAAARYDAAVVGALTDSETAINRFDRGLAALAAARAAAAREQDAHALVSRRQAAGEDDRLALARADLARLAARQQRDRAQAAALEAAIALNKALGGGWTAASDAARRP